MKIILNGKDIELNPPWTLQHLFEQLMWNAQHGFAVSLNDEIIPMSQWNHRTLQENDAIEVIQAVQGG